MNRLLLQSAGYEICRRAVRRTARSLREKDLQPSAMIFAPHPDDETLGCGGLIAKKRMAGAAVRVVFMTDGSGSHRSLIDGATMRDLRRREALQAAACLGVAEADVFFLDFPDLHLSQHEHLAMYEVLGLLRQYRPAQLFVPHHHDGHADHEAANRIVLAALARYGGEPAVFEYPVWLWHQWLRTTCSLGSYKHTLNMIGQGLLHGLQFVRDFNRSLCIYDAMDRKAEALARYVTQMTRLRGQDWLILPDILDGRWLKCFQQEHEIFFQRNGNL